MPKTYSSMLHLNGNLMAAIDLETTGRRPGFHEPIQIAVVPLDSDLRPNAELRPFYYEIKPNFPERQETGAAYVHGLDINQLVLHAPEPGRVQDMLLEWFEKLELPINKCIVPLAHNWAFESAFLKSWLGVDLCGQLFHGCARDAMLLALAINDKAAFMGEPCPFNSVNLGSLCRKFGVALDQAHDALCDSIAEAEVYRNLLRFEI
jgi:DNA polymerase III epsilon subunit-like protein